MIIYRKSYTRVSFLLKNRWRPKKKWVSSLESPKNEHIGKKEKKINRIMVLLMVCQIDILLITWSSGHSQIRPFFRVVKNANLAVVFDRKISFRS